MSYEYVAFGMEKMERPYNFLGDFLIFSLFSAVQDEKYAYFSLDLHTNSIYIAF